jgi:hypothetical protein
MVSQLEDSNLVYFNLHVLSTFYYYINYAQFYVHAIVSDQRIERDEFIIITVCTHVNMTK